MVGELIEKTRRSTRVKEAKSMSVADLSQLSRGFFRGFLWTALRLAAELPSA
jgi:hypothetical protein